MECQMPCIYPMPLIGRQGLEGAMILPEDPSRGCFDHMFTRRVGEEYEAWDQFMPTMQRGHLCSDESANLHISHIMLSKLTKEVFRAPK